MRIEHVAVWSPDLERLVAFYARYFGATVGPNYTNPHTGFESYFLSFERGARLEVMRSPTVTTGEPGQPRFGYAHFAVAVGSEAEVDRLTEWFRTDGVPVVDGPRRTGDGYYESVILDPDGNRIEITV
jgi:lactoylglutathione lyase